LTQHR